MPFPLDESKYVILFGYTASGFPEFEGTKGLTISLFSDRCLIFDSFEDAFNHLQQYNYPEMGQIITVGEALKLIPKR
jgi:hypothetical protein